MTELSLIAPIRTLLLEALEMARKKLSKKKFIKVLATIIYELLRLHPDLTPQKAKKIAKCATNENYSIAALNEIRASEIAKELKAAKKVKPKARKTVKKAVKKAPKRISDSDAVLKIIKRFKKGVDGATLRKKTGFEGRKMRDIVYRLKKSGKIRTVDKGIYMKG